MQTVLILLLLPAYSLQLAITDRNCTLPDGSNYLPSATNCKNANNDDVCNALYTPAVDPANPLERAPHCFAATVAGPVDQNFKDTAIKTCAKTCGYCCQTPEFSCSNPTPSPLDCSKVVQAQCDDPKWKVQLAQFCPATCGRCTEGGCVDATPYCASQAAGICFDPDFTQFANDQCAKTCGRCGLLTTTWSPLANGPAPNSACKDNNNNCAAWAATGFCTSSTTSPTDKKKFCARTCNLCNL